MKIGNREFDTKEHTYIMGILNVTPDSFSDGGRWNDRDRALYHVETMLEEGADIVDVGGESTRPGADFVSEEEEISRVLPVIEAIRARFDIPVSLDTYKSGVASAGIRGGVDLINDIWGLKYDGKMASVIAESGLPCCLMHNRKQADYGNVMQDVLADLTDTVKIAERAQIAREKIILDPGIGFGKTYENNLEILNALESLKALDFPILLGCSRKSVIGRTLHLPPAECLEGTLAVSVIGVMKGCSFVRVHDVKENVRAIRMAEAVLKAEVS
ncbi:MAG: dihydropteroate synthase [Bacteroidales bacterium]|nr:dihydropteroate synthase [Lachnoclostridium sp.]MCM1384996.1 dihydropteroate synthase [Lachnoclostridium sp.]MCM1465884.1 dihydropteroate synthase [Bacteroidales bacterium]